MRTIRFCTALLFCFCCQLAWADAAPSASTGQQAKFSDTEKVLLAEGLAAFNSGLASANPQVVGGIILLTSPLTLAESGGHASGWTGFGAYVAIGAYDASAFSPGYSRRRIFAENFVAWNLLYVVTITAQRFDPKAAPAEHLSIVALPKGGVRVGYHWTF